MSELVCKKRGRRYSVWMTKKVEKAFQKSDAQQQARILKHMERYANDGPEYLIETQFKREGKFPTGGKKGGKIAVDVFKAYQLRVYGGLVPKTGRFVCTELDIKKQNQADQECLKRAARYLSDFIDD